METSIHRIEEINRLINQKQTEINELIEERTLLEKQECKEQQEPLFVMYRDDCNELSPSNKTSKTLKLYTFNLNLINFFFLLLKISQARTG